MIPPTPIAESEVPNLQISGRMRRERKGNREVDVETRRKREAEWMTQDESVALLTKLCVHY